MGFFLDDPYIELTDANEKTEAFGRKIAINRNHLVSFYRKEVEQTYTNVFTSDGRAYIVQETYEQIKELLA